MRKKKQEIVMEIQVDQNRLRPPHRRRICSFTDPGMDWYSLINYNVDDKGSKSHVNKEVLEFMHLLMDECTHMVNYDVPFDPSLIHVVAATDDAYVLRDGVNDFKTIWPGCEVEYIEQGHVSAFLLSQQKFRYL
jgi:hypothetical protein